MGQGFKALALAVLLSANPVADAAMVTLRAYGTIVSVDGNNGFLPMPMTVGDQVTFEYTFDSTSPDTNPADPTAGKYTFGPSFSMTASIGASSYRFNTIGADIIVNDDQDGGLIQELYVVSLLTPAVRDGVQDGGGIGLYSEQPSGPLPPFSSDALPVVGFDVSAFTTQRTFGFSFDRFQDGRFMDRDMFGGHITSIESVSPVPLPAAGWLLLSGLAAIGFAGRRRKAA